MRVGAREKAGSGEAQEVSAVPKSEDTAEGKQAAELEPEGDNRSGGESDEAQEVSAVPESEDTAEGKQAAELEPEGDNRSGGKAMRRKKCLPSLRAKTRRKGNRRQSLNLRETIDRAGKAIDAAASIKGAEDQVIAQARADERGLREKQVAQRRTNKLSELYLSKRFQTMVRAPEFRMKLQTIVRAPGVWDRPNHRWRVLRA